MRAEKVTADIRSDGTLRSITVQSPTLDVAPIFSLAFQLVTEWALFAVDPEEEMASDIESEDWRPIKLAAVEMLNRWQRSPPDTIPSYFAQSEPSPTQKIALLRVIINLMPDTAQQYRLSAQVFGLPPWSVDLPVTPTGLE